MTNDDLLSPATALDADSSYATRVRRDGRSDLTDPRLWKSGAHFREGVANIVGSVMRRVLRSRRESQIGLALFQTRQARNSSLFGILGLAMGTLHTSSHPAWTFAQLPLGMTTSSRVLSAAFSLTCIRSFRARGQVCPRRPPVQIPPQLLGAALANGAPIPPCHPGL